MALSYEIDVSSRLVVIACGNVTFERWREVMRGVFTDPRYAPGFEILIDCRTATLAPSATDVRRVVGFLADYRLQLGTGRVAVVVTNPAGYGMARMASMLAEVAGVDLAAYKDVDEARHSRAPHSAALSISA